MGTRSIVAVPDQARGFRGRYAHWDGYPTGVGEALRTIVNRDGLARATQVLIEEHYGWSSIDGRGESELGAGMSDGRFVVVPGYGVAYTTETGGIPGGLPQSSPEDWHYADGAGDTWCEWAYVLGESELGVFVPKGDRWLQVGHIGYRDATAAERIERGLG